MRNKLLSTVFLCCLCFVLPLQAQEKESNIADMTPEDYAHLKLPPLEVLFENAKNNPIVQINDVKKESETSLLKKEKRSWLKYFSARASYGYGIQAYTSGFSDSATPIYYQYNNNAMSNYSIGGAITIPLDDLFDLKQRTNQQKLKIKEADLQKDQTLDGVKQQIIELYTSILSNISVLKLKAEYMVFANAQYQIGESDFLNGKGDANTLSNQKNVQITAASDYESTRAILNSSILKLEILSRTSIVNKIKTK